MLSVQSDPDALQSAETRIKSTVVEFQHLPEKKSIQMLHAGRQSHLGVTVRPGEVFHRISWVGFQYMVGMGEHGRFIFSQSPTFPLSFPRSPTSLLSLITPAFPFALSPSCLPCSPFFFHLPQPWSLLSQSACGTAPSHSEGDFNYVRRQKHIEQRLTACAAQIKEGNREINYNNETVSFHFILTAW